MRKMMNFAVNIEHVFGDPYPVAPERRLTPRPLSELAILCGS
jgi:hypothetical protein